MPISTAFERIPDVATNYTWDEDNILYETDDNDVVTAQYTYNPEHYGDLICERRDGNTYTHHYDAQGSTIAITDETAAVTDSFAYNAWGEHLARAGGTNTPFRWIGRGGYFWGDDLLYFYARQRNYDPSHATWDSLDQLAFLYLDTGNGYKYALLNPAMFIDPSGLQACCECNLAAAFAVEDAQTVFECTQRFAMGRSRRHKCTAKVNCNPRGCGGPTSCGKTFNKQFLGSRTDAAGGYDEFSISVCVNCNCRPATHIVTHELQHAAQICCQPPIGDCPTCYSREWDAAQSHCTSYAATHPGFNVQRCILCSVALSCHPCAWPPAGPPRRRPRCGCADIGLEETPVTAECDPAALR